MLFSLISVLVLVVIAFYALWIGVMGHVNGNEGPELSLGGRVLMVTVALLAFVSAYLMYSRSGDAPAALAVNSSSAAVPAMSPPSRASTVVAAVDATPATVLPASNSAEIRPAAVADPVADTAPERQSGQPPEGVLSASAALMESEVRGRAALPASPAAKPVASITPARVAVVPVPETLPAKAAIPKTRRTVRPRTARSGPLVLHLDNTLGRDQVYEHLTLSIEGQVVAQLEVDDGTPRSRVSVQLPRAGLLNYRLEGLSEGRRTTQLVGVGCIRVRDGARFVVRRKPGSHQVFLEAARGGR